MRGMNSMAKATIPASAIAFTASPWPWGSMVAMTTAPFLNSGSCVASGRRTSSTTSASSAVSAAVASTDAPALTYSSSTINERKPAPASTATLAPRPTRRFTVSGDAATRPSSGSSSRRTATFINSLQTTSLTNLRRPGARLPNDDIGMPRRQTDQARAAGDPTPTPASKRFEMIRLPHQRKRRAPPSGRSGLFACLR